MAKRGLRNLIVPSLLLREVFIPVCPVPDLYVVPYADEDYFSRQPRQVCQSFVSNLGVRQIQILSRFNPRR